MKIHGISPISMKMVFRSRLEDINVSKSKKHKYDNAAIKLQDIVLNFQWCKESYYRKVVVLRNLISTISNIAL